MNRLKIKTEKIKSPEQLIVFEGWKIKKIYTHKPGVLLQNPLTGEKTRIMFSQECFDKEYIRVQRRKKKQPSQTALTSKKGVEENEKK